MPNHEAYDGVRLHRTVFRNVLRYEQERESILKKARGGDLASLCLLKERWGLRLPKVEARLLFSLPWMR